MSGFIHGVPTGLSKLLSKGSQRTLAPRTLIGFPNLFVYLFCIQKEASLHIKHRPGQHDNERLKGPIDVRNRPTLITAG